MAMLPLLAVGCRTGPGPVERAHVPADGRELVAAMHEAYAGRWPTRIGIRQKVVRHRDGAPVGEEVWTELLQLPGRVRSTIGEEADGNGELYADGLQLVFRDGHIVHESRRLHEVLLLGFDVYVQAPERSIEQLTEAGFDLDALREDDWRGRPVWVVGESDGNGSDSAFWVEPERLLLLRLRSTSPLGNRIEIELDGYERLGGGWIATKLTFFRNGELIIDEQYLDTWIPDSIDPGVFDVERIRAAIAKEEEFTTGVLNPAGVVNPAGSRAG